MARNFDLLIHNGTVVDGTDNELRIADVAINNGCIHQDRRY